MKTTQTQKFQFASLTVAALSLVLTGCLATPSNNQLSTNSSNNPFSATGTQASPYPPQASPSPSPISVRGTASPFNTRVQNVGYTDASFTVVTRSILKVRFTPGKQDQFATGTGYSPTYSRLGVFITVGSQTTQTPLLYNGINGAVQKSDVLNFSSQIPSGCAATDTTCRQTVTIKVQRPNNDYYCYNYGTYCPNTQVYDTHPWNGTLEVETDDTQPIQ